VQYNAYPGREDPFFSPEAFVTRFYLVEVFGPDDEDVCVHDAPGFLPDEPSADVLAYWRHGLPNTQIVEHFKALVKRAEEGELK
jgi:hypothetical protein